MENIFFLKAHVLHFFGLFVYTVYILLSPDEISRKLCIFLLNVWSDPNIYFR